MGPGRGLEKRELGVMPVHLRRDFADVRIHDDERAAASAIALGASGYAIGNRIAFAPGAYVPDTLAGQGLLRHELFHVRGALDSIPDGLQVSTVDDAHEREVSRAAELVEHDGEARLRLPNRPPAGIIHRSVLGTVLGAIGGAVAGAVLGGLVGGPIGALVGGVAGLVGGGLIGSALTKARSRPLTETEKAYARDVFKNSVDYDAITITRDSSDAVGAPRTFGNTINLKSDWGHFKDDTMELTDIGKETLIHEMGHVWQYQNGGLEYLPESLIAQIRATIATGKRNAANDWAAAERAGVPWQDWNPEQQAEAIEDYNKLLRKNLSNPSAMTIDEIARLATLLPYINLVRQGLGAPGGRSQGRPADVRP